VPTDPRKVAIAERPWRVHVEGLPRLGTKLCIVLIIIS
jgi:hypothetical protein